jgi:hypothetical protein
MNIKMIQITPEQLSELLKEVVTEQLEKFKGNSPNAPKEKKLYSREETCQVFGISKPCLHDWTNKGILKSIRVGGRVYYNASQIDLLINKKG